MAPTGIIEPLRQAVAEEKLLSSLHSARVSHTKLLLPPPKPTGVEAAHQAGPNFGPDAAAVRMLGPGLVAAGREPLPGLAALAASRAERHAAALPRFAALDARLAAEALVAVEAAARRFQDWLAASDADIESDFSALADDGRLLELDESNVAAAWAFVAVQLPARGAEIARLGDALDAIETHRGAQQAAALSSLCAELNAIAAVPPGAVDRLVEAAAHGCNTAALANRREAAGITRLLRAGEVAREAGLRLRWVTARDRWRSLQVDRAVQGFTAHITSSVFAPPAGVMASLRAAWADARTRLGDCITAAQTSLLPPRGDPTVAAARAWGDAARALVAQWGVDWRAAVAALAQSETELESVAQSSYGETAAAVAHFVALASAAEDEAAVAVGGSGDGGDASVMAAPAVPSTTAVGDDATPTLPLGAAAASALLETQCLSLVTARREQSLQLLAAVEGACAAQADNWASVVDALASFYESLGELREAHLSRLGDAEPASAAALVTLRATAAAADASAEAAVAAAETRLSLAPSESVLDETLAAVAAALDAVESGYRSAATAATAAVDRHPRAIAAEGAAYQRALCDLLRLLPNAPAVAAEESTAADAVAAGAAETTTAAVEPEPVPPVPPVVVAPIPPVTPPTGATKGGKAAKPTAADIAAAAEAAALAAVPPPPQLPDVPPVITAAGTAYVVGADLYTALCVPPEPVTVTVVEPEPEAVAVVVETKAAPAAVAPPPPPPAVKGKAGKPTAAEVAAAAAADAEAEAARVAIAEAQAAEAAAAAAIPPVVVTDPHQWDEQLSLLPLDIDSLSSLLSVTRVSHLDDMESRLAAAEATAAEWAAARREAIASSLNQGLRAHRPRAGGVEEGGRRARSVVLMEQQRRVDRHVRTALRAQGDAENAAALELGDARRALAALVAKISAAEAALGSVLSTASLDIRAREAADLKAAVIKEIAKVCAALSAKATSREADAKKSDEKFDAEVLRGAADGGAFAPESLEAHRKQLALLATRAASAREAAIATAGALESEMTTGAEAAYASLVAVLGHHKDDVAFVESAEGLVAGAKSRLRAQVAASAAAAREIATTAAELGAILPPAAGRVAAVVPAAVAGRGAPPPPPPVDRMAAILGLLSSLRSLLLPRAVYLQCLASRIDASPVAMPPSLDAILDGPAPAPSAAPPPPTPAPGEKAGGKAGAAPSAKAGVAKGAAPPAVTPAAAASPAPPSPPPRDLMEAAKALVAEAKAAASTLAGAYYASKSPDRAITRPAKIAPDLPTFLASLDVTLATLTETAATHMAAASGELRAQVVSLSSWLPRAPEHALVDLCTRMTAAAESALGAVQSAHAAARAAAAAAQAAHQKALRPGMGSPHNAAPLAALLESEAARAAAAVGATRDEARAAVAALSDASTDFGSRLQRCTELLAVTLDGIVAPEDLVPLAEGDNHDAELAAERKNLRRLRREQRMGGAAGAAAAETAPRDGRPFRERTWPGVPTSALTVIAAGWRGDTSLLAAVGGAPVAPADPAAAAPPADGTAPPPPDGGVPHPPVRALDAIAQQAVFVHRDAAVAAYAAHLASAVAATRATAIKRLRDEAEWRRNWSQMVEYVRAY